MRYRPRCVPLWRASHCAGFETLDGREHRDATVSEKEIAALHVFPPLVQPTKGAALSPVGSQSCASPWGEGSAEPLDIARQSTILDAGGAAEQLDEALRICRVRRVRDEDDRCSA